MEVVNSTTIILTLGVAVITASTTLLASWIANKGQRKIKLIEVKGQQEIKAKELLFENYQRRIDRYSKIGRVAVEKAESSMEQLARTNPTATKDEVIKLFSVMFESIQGPFQDWIEEIEGDLLSLDALETNSRHLEFVKNFLNIGTKEDLSENIQTFYGDFLKTTTLIYALSEEVNYRKCEALFSEYLPTKNHKIL